MELVPPCGINLDEFTKAPFNNLCPDLWKLIIPKCNNLGKFILHFVSKFFYKITKDKDENRELGVSYLMCFIQYPKMNKTKIICNLAVNDGSLNVLTWAYKNGCGWDEFTCALAAKNGNLEVLKWLRNNGCPWNKKPFEFAVMCAHLEVLKWLYIKKCPWNKDDCLRRAIEFNHYDIFKWLVGIQKKKSNQKKKSVNQIFIAYEIGRQRKLQSGLQNAHYKRLAGQEWIKFENGNNNKSNQIDFDAIEKEFDKMLSDAYFSVIEKEFDKENRFD